MKQFKLLFHVVVFVVLTFSGIIWAIAYYDLDFRLLDHMAKVSWTTVLSLLGLFVLLYITDIWRYQVLGAAVHQSIRFKTALETSIANDFFSWITPGAAFGAPAAIYILGQRGVAWDAASIICFAKSMIGSAVLLIATFLCLLLGLTPWIHPGMTLVLLWGFGIVMLIILVPVIAAIFNTQSQAYLDRLQHSAKIKKWFGSGSIYAGIIWLLKVCSQAIDRLVNLKSRGLSWMIAVVIVHVPYLLVFSGMLLVLLLEFGAQFSGSSIGISIVYLGFTYVAPTPGASGLSEATANSFFADLVTPANALIVVVLYRSFTIYLHLLIGIIYLSFVGAIRPILNGQKSIPKDRDSAR